MKRLKLFAVPITLLILLLIIIYINRPVSGTGIGAEKTKANLDDLTGIENAIIIRGIESGPDNEPDAYLGSLKGAIIYNDSFNDINSQKHFSKTNEDIINILKKQDNRWHATPYRIRKGENLWTIAKKYNTDYKLIIKANEIKDPDRLNPGNTILIPNRNGLNHKVIKGETLIKIANKYEVKKNSIVYQNNIKKNVIKEGELLFIPDAIEPAEKAVKSPLIRKSKSDDINEEEAETNITALAKNKMQFIWPVKGEITSAFGKRRNPINNKSMFHCGLDIKADIGTPVKASADGEAIFSGWKKGYGRVVILKHTDGYITVYAHNKTNIIKTGERISKGETIALSGISGAVTGQHVHFEIRKYLTPLNPLRFLE